MLGKAIIANLCPWCGLYTNYDFKECIHCGKKINFDNVKNVWKVDLDEDTLD